MEKQDDTSKPVAENGNVVASSGEYNIAYQFEYCSLKKQF